MIWRCECGDIKRGTKPHACEGCKRCGTKLSNDKKYTKPWKHKFETVTIKACKEAAEVGCNNRTQVKMTICSRCAEPFS